MLVVMEQPTGKDVLIEFLLTLLKEERDKRKELEINLEHTKTLLNEMVVTHTQRERNNHHLHRGCVECDVGIDEVDYSLSKNSDEIR